MKKFIISMCLISVFVITPLAQWPIDNPPPVDLPPIDPPTCIYIEAGPVYVLVFGDPLECPQVLPNGV